jgi:hypothetical protein
MRARTERRRRRPARGRPRRARPRAARRAPRPAHGTCKPPDRGRLRGGVGTWAGTRDIGEVGSGTPRHGPAPPRVAPPRRWGGRPWPRSSGAYDLQGPFDGPGGGVARLAARTARPRARGRFNCPSPEPERTALSLYHVAITTHPFCGVLADLLRPALTRAPPACQRRAPSQQTREHFTHPPAHRSRPQGPQHRPPARGSAVVRAGRRCAAAARPRAPARGCSAPAAGRAAGRHEAAPRGQRAAELAVRSQHAPGPRRQARRQLAPAAAPPEASRAQRAAAPAAARAVAVGAAPWWPRCAPWAAREAAQPAACGGAPRA